ncbi:MAG: alpha/beta fold hydrolase [Labilithrix sp.]|nr:alpha/beta fold hydrolase [Labilithrix sp.]MCW5810835.1 alpha/beta fold hydrolase [Labilithrix sp.]
MPREDVTFESGGVRCGAWLYRPSSSAPHACVVLAHGFSGLRGHRLDAFAERFVAAGLAALVFDYRHFGASEGEPRALVDVDRQLADWRAAVAYARSIDGVDPDRVAIWGCSIAGGHVLVTAAALAGDVAAVVALTPFVDGRAVALRTPLLASLRLVWAGLCDRIGSWLGRPPRMIAVAGPPGSVAMLTSPDAEPGILALATGDAPVDNRVAARIALHIPTYRPIRAVAAIAAPALVQVCDRDAIAPPELAVAAAKAMPRAVVERYPYGHFDVYLGEAFERAVTAQVAFLREHLRP